jgi:ribonucleoside-diphosphate reductase alpha chain
VTTIDASTTLGISRRFTHPEVDPYDTVQWERRDARISNWKTGAVAFEQLDVEFPVAWSATASNIVTQKYFRGTLGTESRETSLKQVIDRVVNTIIEWGASRGYFADTIEAETFRDELKYLLVTQRASFNSPVWFNIGVPGVPQQASACFILAVDDRMDSILNWYTEEGRIFKGGSGAGVNLSKIRSSVENVKGGGTASGPVSFMRGADASAGTIKSGGKTRRAAKMVILNVDHPDVEEFIWCKSREEDKARALAAAGFDMSLDGVDITSVQYQNANNSVRVTDEFMQAVVDDTDWHLLAVTDGAVVKTIRARDLMRQIADAAWRCADPGVQYDTTINRWHTLHATGPINGSNPCSEYMSIDNSSCNLASLNLMKFLADDDTFNIDDFTHASSVMFTAQEILICGAEFPTEQIGTNTRRFRQLGLGYANLGSMLMALGLPYDSDHGRSVAAAVTALMHNTAYATSAEIASRMGPFDGYADNAEHVRQVLVMHAQATENLDIPDDDRISRFVNPIVAAARTAGDNMLEGAAINGVRNAQATVLAPTGTIGLMMDCDTTGVEPELGLVKYKTLVGGGSIQFVNGTVPRALAGLGYDPTQIDKIVAYIDANGSIVGAPDLESRHLPVFACSMGDNVIDAFGHVKMMAAVQPFLSGAISKTCNLPDTATVEEIEELYIEAWRLGVKALAIYRDNCKVAQPMSTSDNTAADDPEVETTLMIVPAIPVRQKLPRTRRSRTFSFRVGDCKGHATVGEYDDGRPGELFLRVSKQGSTLAGIMDAFAISISHGLQYGVPLESYVQTYTGMRFEPAGMTDDPDLRIASSLMDYLFRRLAIDYLDPTVRAELNILTTAERMQPTLPGVDEAFTEANATSASSLESMTTLVTETNTTAMIEVHSVNHNAPMCMQCGIAMLRTGSCHACPSCGSSSGCAG